MAESEVEPSFIGMMAKSEMNLQKLFFLYLTHSYLLSNWIQFNEETNSIIDFERNIIYLEFICCKNDCLYFKKWGCGIEVYPVFIFLLDCLSVYKTYNSTYC